MTTTRLLFALLLLGAGIAHAQHRIHGSGYNKAVIPETLFTAFSDDVFSIPALEPYGSGAITTATVGTTGGANYVEGDELYVSTGTGTLDTLTVTAVDGGGAVTAFTIASGGTGHIVGDDQATTTNSVAGTGAVIDIDAVTDDGGDTQTITVPVAGLDVSKYAAVMFSDLATIPDEDEAGLLAINFAGYTLAQSLVIPYLQGAGALFHVLPQPFRYDLVDLAASALLVHQNYLLTIRPTVILAGEIDADENQMPEYHYKGIEPLVGMQSLVTAAGFINQNSLQLNRIWLEGGAVKMIVQNASPAAEFAAVADLKLLVIQYQ